MSSTSDTSAIDEKKAENEGTTTNTGGANFATFFTNIIIYNFRQRIVTYFCYNIYVSF